MERREFARALCGLCLLLCLSAPLGAAATTAQGGAAEKTPKGKKASRPDLTGTWVLVEDGGKRTRKSAPAPENEIRLEVVHREPELKIIRRTLSDGREAVRESVYYSDGRGETNLGPGITTSPADAREDVLKSKTRWDGDKLVTRTTIQQNVRADGLIFHIIDEWRLSAVGRILTRTSKTKIENGNVFSSTAIVPGPAEFKSVFRRTS